MRSLRRFLMGALAFALAFSAVPASAASYLVTTEFVDSTHGFLGGWYGNPGKGFVSVTDNGGDTWHAVALGEGSPVSVTAESASKAVAVDQDIDRLFSTTDGGVTWARTDPAVNLSPVPVGAGTPTFSDITTSSVGYVAVGTRKGSADGDVATIYTSPNGVTDWTQRFRGPINPPTIDPVYGDVTPGAPTYARLDKVSFAPDGQTGWAIGGEWKDPTYAANSTSWRRLLIYKTTNGGSTWTTQTVAARPSKYNALSDIVAVDATHANAVGPNYESLRTVDGGENWIVGEITKETLTSPALEEVWGVDAIGTTVVAVGKTNNSGAGVRWSTDGGVTWPYHHEDSAYTVKLRAVQMITPTKWIVVGDEETIWRTNNANLGLSATWRKTKSFAPKISVTSPQLGGVDAVVSGNTSDTLDGIGGAGVAAVDVSVKRDGDNWFWNAETKTFGPTLVWNRASTLNGWDTWNWDWQPGAAQATPRIYTVTARATDAVGLTSQAIAGVQPPVPGTSTVTRVPGADRYVVASGLARKGWDPANDLSWSNVTDIVIANGEPGKEADPLTAAGLAGAYNAPVLLVQATRIPASTKTVITEIAKANPANGGPRIHIVGGTGSIPDARWNELKAIPGVNQTKDRLAGSDRYAVSANIASRMVTVLGADAIPGVILIAADDASAFYDALAASPIAYANSMPMLSVRKASVPLSVNGILTASPLTAKPRYAASSVTYIAGSLSGATRLTNSSSRYTAAADIASSAIGAHNWLSVTDTGLTAKLPDALTGGTFLGHAGGVMLFTDSTNTIQPASSAFISAHKADIARGWVIGGTGSVPAAQETSFVNLLK